MSFEDIEKESGKTLNGRKKLRLPIRSISFSGRKSLTELRHVARSTSAKTPTGDTVFTALHPFGKHCVLVYSSFSSIFVSLPSSSYGVRMSVTEYK